MILERYGGMTHEAYPGLFDWSQVCGTETAEATTTTARAKGGVRSRTVSSCRGEAAP